MAPSTGNRAFEKSKPTSDAIKKGTGWRIVKKKLQTAIGCSIFNDRGVVRNSISDDVLSICDKIVMNLLG